jgi:hypothetical protein
MTNDIQNVSVQQGGGIASALLGSTLISVVEGTAIVQIPVMMNSKLGHIYVSTEELESFMKNPVMTEMIAWSERVADG